MEPVKPDPHFLWQLIVTSAFLAGLLVNVLTLLKTRQVQRREISFADNFATQAQLLEVAEDLERVDRDVKSLKESIVVNGEERRVRIEAKVEAARHDAWEGQQALHGRITEVSVQLSEVSGRLDETHKATNQQLVLLATKLDRFLEREADRHHKPVTR